MADVLPMIPNTVPQVRAPESRVSGADIAQPRLLLAQNLARAGEVIEKDVAEPFAEKAGHEAVRTDPNGNLIVDRMPIFGPASITFKKAAMETALSQTLPKVESDLNEIKNKLPNDPAGVRVASKEYADQTIPNLPPELRPSVAAQIARSSEHNYRSATDQAAQTNLRQFLETQKAALVSLREDMTSLARQGGVGQPEYKQKFGEMLSVYKSLGDDPRVLYTPARAEQEISDHRDEDLSQAILGNVLRTYKTKANIVEAQHALREAFDNPDLKLSQQKRDKGVVDGMKLLERVNVEDKLEVQQNQAAMTVYENNIREAPNSYNQIKHDDYYQNSARLNDFKSMARLDGIRMMLPLAQAFKSATPEEAIQISRQMERGFIPALRIRLSDAGIQGMIEQEAKRQGLDPQLAVTIAARESSGDPRAVTGSYKGIYQLSDEGFRKFGGGDIFNPEHNIRAGIASLKADAGAFKEHFGRDPTPTELYLSHQQGQGGIAAHLQNPDAPAWQNMLSTAEGRQKGEAWAKAAIKGNLPDALKSQSDTVTSAQFMQVWEQRIQGIPYAGTGLVPGQRISSVRNADFIRLFESTVKEVRESTGRNATRMAEQIVTQAKEAPIPIETLQTFAGLVTLSGKEDLIDKIQPMLQGRAIADQLPGGPDASAALLSEIAARKSSGVDPATYSVLQATKEIAETNAKQVKEAPLIAASQNGIGPAVRPLQPNTPAQNTAELSAREDTLHMMRASGYNIGNVSAIANDAEGKALNTALTTGDARAAAGILDSMQTALKPETFKATMESPEMKSALGGMIRSKDPARMTAAFSALDVLWRKDAVGFAKNFSSDVEMFHAWLGLRTFMTAEDMAVRFNEANEPSKIAEREKTTAAAKKETKGWTPSDVAYQMGSAMGIPGTGFISRNITGSTPSEPPVVVGMGDVGAQMQIEFEDLYTNQRAWGLPEGGWFDKFNNHKNAKTVAAQMLQTKWNISAVAGNQIMAYPPDLVTADKDTGQRRGAYYPMIGESHDWMKEQLHETIVGALGSEYLKPSEFRAPTPLGPGVRRWTFVGLASDATTQAEISAGKPPSYLAIVNTGNGLNEIVRNPTTGSTRVYFDPLKALADRDASRKEALATEARIRATEERIVPRPLLTQPDQATNAVP
jgi:hypothetical protein